MSPADESLRKVKRAIHDRYGQPNAPSFRFVDEALARARRNPAVRELQKLGDSRDVTDLNDDVALVLSLRSSSKRWTVMLSLVGPYAAVYRESESSSTLLDDGTDLDEQDRRVVAVIDANGWKRLSCGLLKEPVHLRLPGVEEPDVPVFAALFSARGL
jgi:hypothetical protein